jgi:hypothetical protein
MFYHNSGRNTMTDVSSSSADASAAPHTSNPMLDDEDSPKPVVRATSTTRIHTCRKPPGGEPAGHPRATRKGLVSPGHFGLPTREDNTTEAARSEINAWQKQRRSVLTTLQFVYGTRELFNRNP